jgi:hypothetical protein
VSPLYCHANCKISIKDWIKFVINGRPVTHVNHGKPDSVSQAIFHTSVSTSIHSTTTFPYITSYCGCTIKRYL